MLNWVVTGMRVGEGVLVSTGVGVWLGGKAVKVNVGIEVSVGDEVKVGFSGRFFPAELSTGVDGEDGIKARQAKSEKLNKIRNRERNLEFIEDLIFLIPWLKFPVFFCQIYA